MDLSRTALLIFLLAWAALGQAQQVHTAGAARNVMMGTDLSNQVQLDTLLAKPHLYALGPFDDLQGELTVFDGVAYLSAAPAAGVQTSVAPTARAPFLAYAYVPNWEAYVLDRSISGLKDLEALVDSLGQAHGYGADEAFPFRLSGTWASADYHIIMRDRSEEAHSHEAHNEAKVKFSERAVPADLVGFFSRHHEGVFTHRGQYIHVHLLKSDRSVTAHLDGLRSDGPFTLYLPRRTNAAPLTVVDTDFSKGQLGYQQSVGLAELERFHGHLCDGLALGYLGMKVALYQLYPDSAIDRTNTRAVSQASPCLTDAAAYLSGGRYQYHTFYVDAALPYLFVVQRIDNGQAVGVKLRPGVKPAEIDRLGAKAIEGQLDGCELAKLRVMEDAFTSAVLSQPIGELFELEALPSFEWAPVLRSDFLKTDVLNKGVKPCGE